MSEPVDLPTDIDADDVLFVVRRLLPGLLEGRPGDRISLVKNEDNSVSVAAFVKTSAY